MKFEGIDLKIDEQIQKLCEASNKSSASSRSVLYVVIITSILALIAVINTHKGNWANDRKNTEMNEIKRLRTCLLKHPKDSLLINDTLYIHKITLERLIANKIERLQTVSVPILGNSFDINNLSLVVGISFIILLIILRFTLKRERYNLVIVLNSVTDRYPDNADENEFPINDTKINTLEEKKSLLKAINKTRRKYHYNYLSMNDVFTLPSLRINEVDYLATPNENRIIAIIFWLPFIIYCIIVANDIITGWDYDGNKFHTKVTVISGIALTIPVCYFAYKCYMENQQILKQYKLFKQKDYRFEV